MARGSDKKGSLRDVAQSRQQETGNKPASAGAAAQLDAAARCPASRPAQAGRGAQTAPRPPPASSRRSTPHTRGGTARQPTAGSKPALCPAAGARKRHARPETSSQTGPALRRTAADRSSASRLRRTGSRPNAASGAAARRLARRDARHRPAGGGAAAAEPLFAAPGAGPAAGPLTSASASTTPASTSCRASWRRCAAAATSTPA
jgi:hypothetical protein